MSARSAALFTKKTRWWAILGGVVLMLGGIAAFFPSLKITEPSTPSTAISSSTPPASNPNTLSLTPRLELNACLPKPLAEGSPLDEQLLAQIPDARTELEWQVVRVEENDKEMRLRLAREPNENGRTTLQLKIFSVDEEGLPDLVATKKGAEAQTEIEDWLRSKRVLSNLESRETNGSGRDFLRVEKEDGRIVEVEFRNSVGRMACSGRQAELNCQCL